MRHHAAAAVDGQPPSEGAGRRRLGRGARRRHEQPLRDDARRAATRRRAGSGCSCASRSARRRPRRRISAACRRRSPSAARSRRSSSPRRPVSGIACATSCSAIAFISPRSPRSRTATGPSAISAAARAQVSAALAPFVARVIAVDGSAAMLQAAKKRLHGFDNVDLRRGELEALPIDDARLDAATLMLVLHHVPEPAARARRGGARAEAGRPRRARRHAAARSRELPPADGPRLARVRDEHMRRLLERAAGSRTSRIVPLPPDAKAKGPGLFVATATKATQHETRNRTKRHP